jgi:hypothetical protein
VVFFCFLIFFFYYYYQILSTFNNLKFVSEDANNKKIKTIYTIPVHRLSAHK